RIRGGPANSHHRDQPPYRLANPLPYPLSLRERGNPGCASLTRATGRVAWGWKPEWIWRRWRRRGAGWPHCWAARRAARWERRWRGSNTRPWPGEVRRQRPGPASRRNRDQQPDRLANPPPYPLFRSEGGTPGRLRLARLRRP